MNIGISFLNPTPNILQNPEIKQMYIDVMKEDGLENGFDDLKNVKDKRFSLVGDYRKMIGKPEDLKYRMIQYSDPNQNLTVCNSSLSISSRVLILKNHYTDSSNT